AVDLVLQGESPKSVTRALLRIGRACHGVGEVSKGRIFPKFRADLLEATVVVKRMRDGEIEPTVVPRNPLDVLAQQIVAMAVSEDEGEELSVPELYELVRRTYPYAELSRELLDNVLDMLDGRYPSEQFAELRPRIVWDRVADTIRPRKGARQLAVTNAGTIPDRGMYGVHLPDGRRVGELDEEMVYEARPGRTVVVERFRDEIGDWRLCVLSPFGGRVHAAWGLALSARLRDEAGLEADAIWSDDGIVVHLPDADEPPPADLVLIDPEELEELVVRELGSSALFGARFRENAARALLLPRAYPGKRTPLWQQRLKAQ